MKSQQTVVCGGAYALMLMLVTFSLFGQSNDRLYDSTIVNYKSIVRPFIKTQRDSILSERKDSRMLSDAAFNTFFRNKMSLLTYDRLSPSQGNTASLSYSQDETVMNLSIGLTNNHSIFTFGTKVNVNDKSGTIFSENKPTTGSELFFDHSFLFRKKSRRVYYEKEINKANQQSRLSVLDSTELEINLFRSRFNTMLQLEGRSLKENKRLKELLIDLDSLSAVKKDCEEAATNLAYRKITIMKQLKDDSLCRVNKNCKEKENLLRTAKIEKGTKAIDSLKTICEGCADFDSTRWQYLQSDSIWLKVNQTSEALLAISKMRTWGGTQGRETTAKLESRLADLELSAPGLLKDRLQWISYGVSYRSESFSTYDSLKLPSDRFKPFQQSIWAGYIAFNSFFETTDRFTQSRKNSKTMQFLRNVYFGMTYRVAGGNSYSTLDDITFTTIISKGQPDSLFQTSTTQTAKDVTGMKVEYLVVHKLGIQFSGMFTGSPVGINILASGELQKTNIVANFRIGTLFKYTDANDTKSKVNFELFLDLKDISDTRGTGKNAFDRSTIGVSANVPFKKLLFE